jgi:hypothetical protein
MMRTMCRDWLKKTCFLTQFFVIGKKIGEVIVISDFNYEDTLDSAYYTKEERTYRIVTRFAIK